MTIQTVPVDGEDSAQFTIRGHPGQCPTIQCVPRADDGKKPDFPRRKMHPGRTVREVASDTPVEADLQFL